MDHTDSANFVCLAILHVSTLRDDVSDKTSNLTFIHVTIFGLRDHSSRHSGRLLGSRDATP